MCRRSTTLASRRSFLPVPPSPTPHEPCLTGSTRISAMPKKQRNDCLDIENPYYLLKVRRVPMIYEGKITSKGQTTIPKEIRQKLNLKAGDKISWSLEGERVVFRAKNKSITD